MAAQQAGAAASGKRALGRADEGGRSTVQYSTVQYGVYSTATATKAWNTLSDAVTCCCQLVEKMEATYLVLPLGTILFRTSWSKMTLVNWFDQLTC